MRRLNDLETKGRGLSEVDDWVCGWGAAQRHRTARSGMKEIRDGRQTFEVGGERVEQSEW
jgi:hypothetical protein